MAEVKVDFPDDSVPYISVTLPLGIPPIPRALSRDGEQVEIASIFTS